MVASRSRSKPLPWLGSLEIGQGWARWRGAIGDASVHRHFAAQVVTAPDLTVVEDGSGAKLSGRCVLIEPFAPHRVARTPQAELIFVEPSGLVMPEVAALLRPVTLVDPVVVLPSPTAAFWPAWLAGNQTGGDPDQRVRVAMAFIDAALPDGAIALSDAARRVDLSAERFRHLFKERVGMPFRRFVLWRRLRLAATELVAGADATTAAHGAGFADVAHFARTLKLTFGVTSSQIVASSDPGKPW
jgi:AraC-like DNA-binding protein